MKAVRKVRTAILRVEASQRRTDKRSWAMKRRERTRNLIELGGLVQKAGLSELTDDEPPAAPSRLNEKHSEFRFEPYQGESTTQALVNQRVGQDFFRRAVLANYEETCCITGIADPRLLTASHIKPWGKDSENRHNPANGLLLSATLDRAFDRGLITVDRQRRIRVSRQLRESQSRETRDYFRQFDKATLRSAIRFDPEPAFLDWHNEHCFVDQSAA